MTHGKSGNGKYKILYLIFSIVFAVALWGYVSYVQNNVKEGVEFKGVQIIFIGKERLADNELVITSIDTEKVDLTCTVRYNTLTHMNVGNIIATVDLAEILQNPSTGLYQLPVKISYDSTIDPDSVSITKYSPQSYVGVRVEKMIRRQVQVRAFYEGGAAEGYRVAGEPTVSADTITIFGSSEAVSSVEYAAVTLNRENLSRSTSAPAPVKLIDAEGKEISDQGLTLSADTLTVGVTIEMVKEVPLTVNFEYTNSATPKNTFFTVSPPTIRLAGDPEVLEDYNSCTLTAIDLNSFGTTFEDTYIIRNLPNGVQNLSNITSATVKFEIKNVEVVSLPISSIMLKSDDRFDDVEIVTQSLEVTLRGSADDIASILAQESYGNIRIIGNLNELPDGASGDQTISARVAVDGYPAVDAIGVYTVSVIVR